MEILLKSVYLKKTHMVRQPTCAYYKMCSLFHVFHQSLFFFLLAEHPLQLEKLVCVPGGQAKEIVSELLSATCTLENSGPS